MWYKTSNNHRLANQKYHIIHEYSASQIHQVSHFIKFIFLICAAYSAANGITFQTILPLDTQYNRTPHPTVSPNPIPQYLILSRHSHSQPRAINTTVPYRIPPPELPYLILPRHFHGRRAEDARVRPQHHEREQPVDHQIDRRL